MPMTETKPRFRRSPPVSEMFTLGHLEMISGVRATTILRWQIRKAIHVPPVGTGNPRLYCIWDAVHAAVIAEMTMLGLRITGDGQDLSLSLTRYIRTHLIRNSNAEGLRPVAIWWEHGSLLMDLDADVERPGSFVTFSLRQVAEGVLQRYATTTA